MNCWTFLDTHLLTQSDVVFTDSYSSDTFSSRHLVNKVSLIKCISTFKQSIKLISKLDCPSFNMISLTTMPVNYKLLDGYTIMHASDQ